MVELMYDSRVCARNELHCSNLFQVRTLFYLRGKFKVLPELRAQQREKVLYWCKSVVVVLVVVVIVVVIAVLAVWYKMGWSCLLGLYLLQ